MAGNPAFIDQAAFSFMKEVNREFTFIWTVITPFISMLQGKSKNFNNQRYKKPGGLYMGTPVGLSDLATPAYPETFANQGTPATFVKTNGATQATYFYATYKQFIWLTNQEQTELEDKSTSFADIATYKTEQLKEDFRLSVGTDAAGSQQDAGLAGSGRIMGELYPLSTTANPGQIPQSTNAFWQAGVNSNGGSFNQQLISNEIDRIYLIGRGGGSDFIQLSNAGGNNVYGKLYQVCESAQVLTREEDTASFGFKSFEYRGHLCFMDGQLPSGTLVVGTSSSWMCNLDTMVPRQMSATQNGDRVPGTLLLEFPWWWKLATGISDPILNSYISGITS